jgi:hypothetical protein
MMMATYNLPIVNQQAYDAAVEAYLGQQTSIFESYMIRKDIPQDAELLQVRRYKETESAEEQNERFGDTQYQDMEYTFRELRRRRFKTRAFAIDKYDKVGVNFSPDSDIVQESVAQLMKKKNEIFISAFTAPVTEWTGMNAGEGTATTKNFISGNVVPANYVASGTPAVSGLTIAKIERLIELMEDNNLIGDHLAVSGMSSDLCMLVSEEMTNQLLKDPQASSADYAHLFVYDNAKSRLESFRGIKFIYAKALIPKATVSGDVIADCYAWRKDGLVFSNAELTTFANSDLAHKENNSQVRAEMSYNVMRMWEEKCFTVKVKVK